MERGLRMSLEKQNLKAIQVEHTKIWNTTFISIFFAAMTMNMGQYMTNSLLGIYSYSLGIPLSYIGMLMSTYAISSIIFRFISGPIMDSYNRKHVVIVAMFILAVAYYGYSISKNIVSLMGFRLLQGCGMAFGNACCLAMAAETLPKNKYGMGIGYYSMAQMLSQATGPLLGLWLVNLVGFSTTYIINSSVMILGMVLALRIKVNIQKSRKLKISFNNIIAKEALLPATLQVFLASGNSVINSFLIIFSRIQGVYNIGIYFTVTALMMLFTRPIVGKLTDKYGFSKIFIPAVFCNIITFIIISISSSIWYFLIAAFISSFGVGACIPSLQALTMKSVTNERRGAGSTTFYIGSDLGHLISPSIAGGVAHYCGYITMWRVMIAPFIIAISIAYIFGKRINGIEQGFIQRQESRVE